jgi:hypothetical protein
MAYHVFESDDPFRQHEEKYEAQIKCLNAEIIRLKIKCGEDFTDREIFEGFGNMPTVFVSKKVLERFPRLKESLDKENEKHDV